MTDRRQLLRVGLVAVAGVAVLPGCTSESAPEEQPSAAPDPQQSDELALIAAYDSAIAAAAVKNVEVLTAIREEHAEHLRALGWQSAVPSPPASPQSALGNAALLRAERRAARLRADGARDTSDAEQAQVLALIAASESQHVITLESL